MSKGWLILGLSTIAIFAGIKLSQAAKTAENIYDKIKYGFSNLKMKISKSVVYLTIDVDVTNLSSFNIPVKNLSVIAQYKKDDTYTDLAYTKKPVSSFTIKANDTSKLTGLTLDIPLGTAVWNIFQALIGKITEIKLITTYYIQGFEQKAEQIIPINIKKSTVSGFGDVDDEIILEPLTGFYNGTGITNAINLFA